MPLLKEGGDTARWTLGHPRHVTAATGVHGCTYITSTLLGVTAVRITPAVRLYT